jgi:hypothetical protein
MGQLAVKHCHRTVFSDILLHSNCLLVAFDETSRYSSAHMFTIQGYWKTLFVLYHGRTGFGKTGRHHGAKNKIIGSHAKRHAT